MSAVHAVLAELDCGDDGTPWMVSNQRSVKMFDFTGHFLHWQVKKQVNVVE
jgi:hypothetical protein